MISSLLLVALGLVSQTSAACTRDTLQAAANEYVAAQTTGTPSLLSLTPSFSYLENNVSLPVTSGILSQPITIDLNRSLIDTTQCATFTELSCASNKVPYVIHTRMLFSGDGGMITAVQSVVAKEGDWAFDAKAQLKWSAQEIWGPIPSAKQDTYAVIKAAGDAYLDSWGNSSIKVPYGAPCARLEGGSYTGSVGGTTNTCKMPQFPGTLYAGNRKYVVDVDLGAVDIFDDFPFIDKARPNGTSSSNLIRVEGGLIRYIHEVTVCEEKNCGR
ncbi:hypothetical protein L207DRAFT_511089 [Hyaloscypha variabilis F]|uniref:DUF8021 domain-containing protein n=1 Tax=Hyaloscypha variabilis (strain UAMH 11265 / GT02V1 / F) TaxID=1149755 RepID=A0A2J6RRJ0_HYAVF|nr:hypothetical protein L207DRAFT_511089 [Hyaloscypha variabilis F]